LSAFNRAGVGEDLIRQMRAEELGNAFDGNFAVRAENKYGPLEPLGIALKCRRVGAGRCEHEHGPSLAMETARRLGCDASVVAVLEDENGEPLNVGRKTRTIPPAIRHALFSRDKDGCRFPGCTNKHYVDGHHIKHWAHGGETRLSNLVLLCRFHHRQVHEGGVAVQVLDDGALRFVVNGRSFESPVPARAGTDLGRPSQDVAQGNWSQLVADLSAGGIHVTPDTAVTRWRGERMDYGTAVDALLYHRRRTASLSGVSAETCRS
jgi:hypothetical protein